MSDFDPNLHAIFVHAQPRFIVELLRWYNATHYQSVPPCYGTTPNAAISALVLTAACACDGEPCGPADATCRETV